MRLVEHEPLAKHTSFRIGGPGHTFAQPESIPDLQALVARLNSEGTPRFILGGGTNVLFDDGGFHGVVISTARLLGLELIGDDLLRAEPGVPLKRVIKKSLSHGLQGIETLLGIPGSIGGAVWGNAGAADHWIGDHVERVTVVEEDGHLETIEASELGFRYRASNVGRRVIAEVFLRLERLDKPEDLEALRDRALEVFARKLSSQPLTAFSAGCVFRNPPGDHAARLIDRAGLKGVSIGGARVSERHANFIINDDGATAQDVEDLIDTVRRRVHDQFGHWLEREIIRAGDAKVES